MRANYIYDALHVDFDERAWLFADNNRLLKS